jgi:malonate-semialdehyde dehydrogenase (acetylating) / methylmalonate-semialdehyde dehydrogenase
MKYPLVRNSVGGGPVPFTGEHVSLVSPLDGSVLSEVPRSGVNEIESAVRAAAAAFPDWAGRTLKQRAQVAYRYRELLLRDIDRLALLIHEENGKTLDEGRAEVVRAVEVTEFACSLPQLAAGEVLEVSPGVECRVDRTPLGVVASIAPFNFPIMVPHWTIPIALTLGNTFVFKPSDKVPLSAVRTAELLAEAGLPGGVFNVVHGERVAVEALCDHPDVRAVTFVGSTPVAKSVYVRATSHLKRALALGGAKNHLIVLPDAPVARTAENVVASMAGCAGQRCMAAATLLAVGTVDDVVREVCVQARRLIPGKNLGPVISAEARRRIEDHITGTFSTELNKTVNGADNSADIADGTPGQKGGAQLQ